MCINVLVLILESGIILSCCCKGKCDPRSKYYYPNGDMFGSLVYWYERPVKEFFFWTFRFDKHGQRNESTQKYQEQLKQHCENLEKEQYGSSTWFRFITDGGIIDFFMLRKNVKVAYIKDSKGDSYSNIAIDKGNGFHTRDYHSIDLIAPIYQCCRISERTYGYLIDLKDNFRETFLEMSKADLLYPLLSDEHIKDMETSYDILMEKVEDCIRKRGKDAVMIKT